MLNYFEKLLQIGKRKINFDKKHSWSIGSRTYLNEINRELDEVKEELDKNRTCYLEEELGDVLWDYINILVNLEEEKGINIESVLNRACKKFDQRVSGIENGLTWNEIKMNQKKELENEHKSTEEKIRY